LAFFCYLKAKNKKREGSFERDKQKKKNGVEN